MSSSSTTAGKSSFPLIHLNDLTPYSNALNNNKPPKNEEQITELALLVFSVVGICTKGGFLPNQASHLTEVIGYFNDLKNWFFEKYEILLKGDIEFSAFRKIVENKSDSSGEGFLDAYSQEYRSFLRVHPMPVQLMTLFRTIGYFKHFKGEFREISVSWRTEDDHYSKLLFSFFDPNNSSNFFDLDKCKLIQYIYSKAALCFNESPDDDECKKGTVKWTNWYSFFDKWFDRCSDDDRQRIKNLFKYLGIASFEEKKTKATFSLLTVQAPSFKEMLAYKSIEALKISLGIPELSQYIEEGIARLCNIDEYSRKQILLVAACHHLQPSEGFQFLLEQRIPEVQTLEQLIDINRKLATPVLPIELFDRNFMLLDATIKEAIMTSDSLKIECIVVSTRKILGLLTFPKKNAFFSQLFLLMLEMERLDLIEDFFLLMDKVLQYTGVPSSPSFNNEKSLLLLLQKIKGVNDFLPATTNFLKLEQSLFCSPSLREFIYEIPITFWIDFIFIRGEDRFNKAVSRFVESMKIESFRRKFLSPLGTIQQKCSSKEHISFYYQLYFDYLLEKISLVQLITLISLSEEISMQGKPFKISTDCVLEISKNRKQSSPTASTIGSLHISTTKKSDREEKSREESLVPRSSLNFAESSLSNANHSLYISSSPSNRKESISYEEIVQWINAYNLEGDSPKELSSSSSSTDQFLLKSIREGLDNIEFACSAMGQLNFIGYLFNKEDTQISMKSYLSLITNIWQEFDLTHFQMAAVLFDYLPKAESFVSSDRELKNALQSSRKLLNAQVKSIKHLEKLVNHKLSPDLVFWWLIYAPEIEATDNLWKSIGTDFKKIDPYYQISTEENLESTENCSPDEIGKNLERKFELGGAFYLLKPTPKQVKPFSDCRDRFHQVVKQLRVEVLLAIAPVSFHFILDFLSLEAMLEPSQSLTLMNKDSKHGIAMHRTWIVSSADETAHPVFSLSFVNISKEEACKMNITLPVSWGVLKNENGKYMKLLRSIGDDVALSNEAVSLPVRSEIEQLMEQFVQMLKCYFYIGLRWVAIPGTNKFDINPDFSNMGIINSKHSIDYLLYSKNRIINSTIPLDETIDQILLVVRENNPKTVTYTFEKQSSNDFESDLKHNDIRSSSSSPSISDCLILKFSPENNNKNIVNEVSLSYRNRRQTIVYGDLAKEKTFPTLLRWHLLSLLEGKS